MKNILIVAGFLVSFNAFADEDNVLEWDDVNGEDMYHIESTPAACGNPANVWTEIGTTPADVLTFTESNVASGETRCYRVAASNIGGKSGYSNEAGKTVRPVTPGMLRVKS
jgi:hypothetical protein